MCSPSRLGGLALISVSLLLARPLAAQEQRGVPDGVDPQWSASVGAGLALREYEVTWQGDTGLGDLPSSYQAPNRVHGFRTYFAEGGVRIAPRDRRTADWRWGFEGVGWGRGGDLRPFDIARLSVSGPRVEYPRGAVLEWYENKPDGLEQGFTVYERPDGDSGPVRIGLRLSGTLGAILSSDGQALDLEDETGRRVLHYGNLLVKDAVGKPLPARLQSACDSEGTLLEIAFDDTGATYPVTVDPLTTTPSWSLEGNTAYVHMGKSVTSAGDINGDGYTDVAVGTPDYTYGLGAVYVLLGSTSGVSATGSTLVGPQNWESFGTSVAAAGDVNGDGYGDLIIGAPLYDYSGLTDSGAAFLYYGSSTGTLTLGVSIYGTQASQNLGASVATAGDVNGDGYSDIAVGAPNRDDGTYTDNGKVFVYYGAASFSGTESDNSADWSSADFASGRKMGTSVAPAGDFNGDGFGDLCATGDGGASTALLVWYGSSTGLAATLSWGSQPGGYAVASTAGDVNGDGYSDLIVGRPYVSGTYAYQGSVYLFAGAASPSYSPAWTMGGAQASQYFGTSVFTAGDVNGDGYSDVILGSAGYDGDLTNEGLAQVYLGSPTAYLETGAHWNQQGDNAGSEFGNSVCTAGDVNGDGFSDVIVGAWAYTNGETQEGRAAVFHGSAGGITAGSNWSKGCGQAEARYGWSVASAGDVNGDGFGDVLVGAPEYDNGNVDEGMVWLYHGSASGLNTAPTWWAESNQDGAYFGKSVAGLCSVNGDGYSDVIIGAPSYDSGTVDEGAAFVWYGSSTGLGTAGTPTNADWIAQADQGGSAPLNAWPEFGVSVASAGDVNGDGYCDLLVGAPGYNDGTTDEGEVFLWYGSAAGLVSGGGTPANEDWNCQSGQSDSDWGRSVASAGDVNGDGFSDILVGAPLYDSTYTNEGTAICYHGRRTGGPTAAPWQYLGGADNCQLGTSVASAGDTDSDGYADAIIGVPGYSSNTGTVRIYHGGASGLGTLYYSITGTANSLFGSSVAGAGDVNGDGYADVLVGAFQGTATVASEGYALLYRMYFGGYTGQRLSSGQAGAWFGYSVASAGDVNGDGYADILVGSPNMDGPPTDEGYAFLWYGTGGSGRKYAFGQRTGTDTPIDRLGRYPFTSTPAIKGLLTGFLGRGKVRLQCEFKGGRTPFDGTGLVRTGPYDSGLAGYAVNMGFGISGGYGVFHWRARAAQSPTTSPFQPWGPWYTQPWGGSCETDYRNWSDTDGDGLPYEEDNCPTVSNPTQTDTDSDGQGDACDTDDDNDGVMDTSDPNDFNPDICGDIDGDTCDDCAVGTDNFGPLPDNLPNNDGTDTDSDGLCNTGDPDDDNDGVLDATDPNDANPSLCGDTDADGCDDCAVGTDDFGPLSDSLPANDGADNDSDGLCNVGDTDDDNDGISDAADPDDANPHVCGDSDADGCDDCAVGVDGFGPLNDSTPGNDGTDTDGDGRCDIGDPDIDNDGVLNATDPNDFTPDICGDSDGDSCDDCGVGTDNFGPLSDSLPANDGLDTDADGLCDAGDPDDDNDGVPDATDPSDWNPDLCGDSDADGCDDCVVGTDNFGPLSDSLPGNDGTDTDGDGLCDAGDPDTDNDGVSNAADPSDSNPHVCGDSDADACDDCAVGSDGFGPLSDSLPGNDGLDTDADGLCNTGDPDDDGDGTADGVDCLPLDSTHWAASSVVRELRLAGPASATVFTWLAPASPGCTTPRYDLLVSRSPSNFTSTFDVVCVEWDGTDLTASDANEPNGTYPVLYYLVRVENSCGSNMGGQTGRACP